MPSYLSKSDPLTVAEFLQTHYAAHYQVDVNNVHWGGETNSSHLFDIFCKFQSHGDSVKCRIDMISFITANYQRYSWNCHLFLRMNQLMLNDWVNKMTYWGNCRDALSIYAMSDMCGVHSGVVTKSKLWTTVDNTYDGMDIDVLKLCQVKLVYLGNDKFGKLIPKDYVGQSSYVTPTFNLPSMVQQPPPVTPAQPLPSSMTTTTTSEQELETAEALLELHSSNKTRNTMNLTTPASHPENIDAMDKIVGCCDTSNSATNVLKVPDAMDSIVRIETDQTNVLNVETEAVIPKAQDLSLNVETENKLQACHICIRPLENILRDEDTETETDQPRDVPSGVHYMRSRSRKNVLRTCRKPCKASEGKHYEESLTSPLLKGKCRSQ